MQNVVYNSHGNEYNEESGIIIQKLGMALAIHNDRTDEIDVIHSRDVLRVGVSTKEADEMKLIDNTNNGMGDNSEGNISEQNKLSSIKMFTTSGRFKIDLKNKRAWKKWLTRSKPDKRASSWTWYDKIFSEHMLRYVLTTPMLEDFEAHREFTHASKRNA